MGLGQTTEVLISLLEDKLPLAQLVLEVLGEVVPHQRLPFPLLGQVCVDDVLVAIPEVGLGKAAGDAVNALAEGFEEHAAAPQVSRLHGHVLADIMKEAALRAEVALLCTPLKTIKRRLKPLPSACLPGHASTFQHKQGEPGSALAHRGARTALSTHRSPGDVGCPMKHSQEADCWNVLQKGSDVRTRGDISAPPLQGS